MQTIPEVLDEVADKVQFTGWIKGKLIDPCNPDRRCVVGWINTVVAGTPEPFQLSHMTGADDAPFYVYVCAPEMTRLIDQTRTALSHFVNIPVPTWNDGVAQSADEAADTLRACAKAYREIHDVG